MAVTTDVPAELAEALRRLSIDLHGPLAEIPVPAFVLDKGGYVRWLNASALDMFGDRRGEHYTCVVPREDRRAVGDQFARKVSGTARSTAYEATVVTRDGSRFVADLDTVRIEDHGRVVGVFGVCELEDPAVDPPRGDIRLTPRQLEVLRLLAGGWSTEQVAQRLHLSTETVRNHVRNVLKALNAHSRLEAVARARTLGVL